MKTLIQTYLPCTGFKDITVQSLAPVPSVLDRFTINDNYGSSIQMDVGVINSIIETLAKSRNMSVMEYLEAIKKSVMQ